MPFPWMTAAIGANTLGSLFGGGGGDSGGRATRVATGEQLALLKALMAEQYGGGGDMLGPYLREGLAGLGSEMARRGISATSPAYQGAMQNVYSNAISQAAQNRFQNLFGLMQTAPATIDASAYKDIGGDTYAGKGSWTPTGFQWNTGSAPKTLDSLRRGGFFRGRY